MSIAIRYATLADVAEELEFLKKQVLQPREPQKEILSMALEEKGYLKGAMVGQDKKQDRGERDDIGKKETIAFKLAVQSANS